MQEKINTLLQEKENNTIFIKSLKSKIESLESKNTEYCKINKKLRDIVLVSAIIAALFIAGSLITSIMYVFSPKKTEIIQNNTEMSKVVSEEETK